MYLVLEIKKIEYIQHRMVGDFSKYNVNVVCQILKNSLLYSICWIISIYYFRRYYSINFFVVYVSNVFYYDLFLYGGFSVHVIGLIDLYMLQDLVLVVAFDILTLCEHVLLGMYLACLIS
jgi:hypothetical protein